MKEWYKIKKIKSNLYCIHEPEHVSFYFFLENEKALFVDTGLGLNLNIFNKEVLKKYQIKDFDILVTHAHCDHVGFNFLGSSISMSKYEWEKYKHLNEREQINSYYHWLKDDLSWPALPKSEPFQEVWGPTAFLNDGDEISWNGLKFQIMHLPGHTVGSLAFYEENTNTLFLGDFLYNGTLYLHLKDSCLRQFIKSLDKLKNFFKHHKPVLLPCHNDIPLDFSYLTRLEHTLKVIATGKLKPVENWRKNEVFDQAKVFEQNDVRIAIKEQEVKLLRGLL